MKDKFEFVEHERIWHRRAIEDEPLAVDIDEITWEIGGIAAKGSCDLLL